MKYTIITIYAQVFPTQFVVLLCRREKALQRKAAEGNNNVGINLNFLCKRKQTGKLFRFPYYFVNPRVDVQALHN
jgi:hypothetical protein